MRAGGGEMGGNEMIDLHVHLLPGWDDGATSLDEARVMADIARRDGITKIGVTPHVFRMAKHDGDWAGLADRVARFKEAAGGFPCEIFWGAEVFIQPDIVKNIREHGLTVNKSDYFFLEFPADSVWPGAQDFLYEIMLQGFIPIISHPERNAEFQARPRLLYEIVEMNCLAQVTAKSILGEFGPEAKRAADLFLSHNLVHIIASDAHDPLDRPPKLSRAVKEAAKIVGKEKAEAMVTAIPEAILENKAVGNWGDPKNPEKEHKKWTIRIPWKK
jgi:protein-tyrosine phosphatase